MEASAGLSKASSATLSRNQQLSLRLKDTLRHVTAAMSGAAVTCYAVLMRDRNMLNSADLRVLGTYRCT